jgi:hypothetical protein
LKCAADLKWVHGAVRRIEPWFAFPQGVFVSCGFYLCPPIGALPLPRPRLRGQLSHNCRWLGVYFQQDALGFTVLFFVSVNLDETTRFGEKRGLSETEREVQFLSHQ